MNKYSIDEKYRYESKTVTKGTQEKYRKDNYYYKINKAGNEGYVEYLVSTVLRHSTLKADMYVLYEYCTINGAIGCRSKNFLEKDEQFLTISTLHERVTGKTNLSDELMLFRTAGERLNYILKIVEDIGISADLYREYMKIMLQLDWLIMNTDRHVHNYGVIYNNATGEFRTAPIFDNGLSLNTNRNSSNVPCTISGSYEDQIVAFGYPITPAFKIDYKALSKDLNRIEELYGNQRELDILREQLEKCKNVLASEGWDS